MSTVLQKTYFHVSGNGNGTILGKYMCFVGFMGLDKQHFLA